MSCPRHPAKRMCGTSLRSKTNRIACACVHHSFQIWDLESSLLHGSCYVVPPSLLAQISTLSLDGLRVAMNPLLLKRIIALLATIPLASEPNDFEAWLNLIASITFVLCGMIIQGVFCFLGSKILKNKVCLPTKHVLDTLINLLSLSLSLPLGSLR